MPDKLLKLVGRQEKGQESRSDCCGFFLARELNCINGKILLAAIAKGSKTKEIGKVEVGAAVIYAIELNCTIGKNIASCDS